MLQKRMKQKCDNVMPGSSVDKALRLDSAIYYFY
jgi:hypothetical protein